MYKLKIHPSIGHEYIYIYIMGADFYSCFEIPSSQIKDEIVVYLMYGEKFPVLLYMVL